MQGKFLRTGVVSECDKILKGIAEETDKIRATGFVDGTTPDEQKEANTKIDVLEKTVLGISMIRAFAKSAVGDKSIELDGSVFDYMWQTGAFRSEV